MTKPARISTAPRPRKPVDVLDAPTAAEWLTQVDPTLATLFNQVEERLQKAQDEERDAHPPIDWDSAQQELAEEQIALLIAGGKMIDVGLSLSEFAVLVRQKAAAVEVAAFMAMANAGLRMPQQPRALLPPAPADSGSGDDSEPPDDDDNTDKLRAIRRDALDNLTEQNEDLGLYGLDSAEADPDAETVEIVKAVAARPRASDGRGLRWWARISMVATTMSAALTGLALAGATLAQWAIS